VHFGKTVKGAVSREIGKRCAGKKWDSVTLEVEGTLKALWLKDNRSVYCVSEQGEIVHVTFDSKTKMTRQDKFVAAVQRSSLPG
jgi:hypothetical protein